MVFFVFLLNYLKWISLSYSCSKNEGSQTFTFWDIPFWKHKFIHCLFIKPGSNYPQLGIICIFKKQTINKIMDCYCCSLFTFEAPDFSISALKMNIVRHLLFEICSFENMGLFNVCLFIKAVKVNIHTIH